MATRTGVILLVLFAAFMTAAQAVTLQEFVTPYLYPGENYSTDVNATQLEAQGERFLIVQVRGVDAFFLRRTTSAQNETLYLFVNDTSQIYSVLRNYYNSTGYPSEAELEDIRSRLLSFNASRMPNEFDCKISVGLDRPGATCEVDRCESCMSVPYCSDKMPYFGNDFALTIHNYLVNSKGMNTGLEGAMSAIGSLKTGTADPSTYLKFITGNISFVSANADAIQSNHLFGCVALTPAQMPPIGLEWCAYRAGSRLESQWCKELTHNRTFLTEASAKAALLQGRIVSSDVLSSRANAIYSVMNARANALQFRIENDTFSAFYTLAERRAGNVTQKATSVLAKVDDDQLESDIAAISGLLLTLSQYGVARNFTSANSTAAQLYVLADKIEASSKNLSDTYSVLIQMNDTAGLALFRARLYLEPQDRALGAKLAGYVDAVGAINEALSSGQPLDTAEMAEFTYDLSYFKAQSQSVIDEKQSQRAKQASSWIAEIARVVSEFIIDAISAVIFISPEGKESTARSLPTVIVILGGLLTYGLCLGAFAVTVLTKKIRLHRVAVFLWAVIFAFLFVLTGIGIVTANSVVQQQAARSTFGLFSREVSIGSGAVVVVVSDGADAASLGQMRACASALGSNLTALGKSVRTYEFGAGSCTANGTSVAQAECEKEFGDNPLFLLNYGNETKSSFYVYYVKEASFYGGAQLYEPCYVARVFNPPQ